MRGVGTSTTREAYATPATALRRDVALAPAGAPGDTGRAEALRRRHLAHEAALRSTGSLYLLVASLGIAACGFAVSALVARALAGAMLDVARLVSLLPGVVAATLCLVIGAGIVRLRPWCRAPVIALSAIAVASALLGCSSGVQGAPVVAVVNGYVLYLFASRSGAAVLSAPYAHAVGLTPHLRYRTRAVTWLALAALAVVASTALARAV